MNILNIVCIFFYLERIWGQEQKYVVLAPKSLHIGASETVVVQAHGYKKPFAVSVAIKSYPDKSFTYSRGQVYLSPENKLQGSTNLTIQPKDLSGGPNAVSRVYLEVTCAHFSKSTPIPLCYDNGFIFVQTDKSVYSAYEPVKVRAYALDEDLKPSQREVTLTFIDPEGSESSTVGKNIYPGITTFHDFYMQLSPKYGLWTIKAKYKEDFTTTGTAHFEVKFSDSSPRSLQFTIFIEPEDDFISHKNFEDFKITIRAGHNLNESIPKADVFVLFGIRENLDNNEELMLAGRKKTKLIDGVAQVHFNTSKALKSINKKLEDINNKYLNIFVDVQKDGYFDYENKVTDVKYVLFPYSLDLVDSHLIFKPGIPFSIKVQVKNVVGHVVKGVAVILKAKAVQKMTKTDLDVRQSKTDSDGIASFTINISSDVSTLEFHVRTDDPDLPEEYQASKDYQAVAYAGQRQSFLSLSWPDSDKSLLVGEHLSVTVTPKSPYMDRITHYNYLISSRGKIRHFGTMKKLPGFRSQPLDLLVTQHMAPAACLLVYFFVRENRRTELVSDSVCLKVEEKCGNPLQIHLTPSRDSHFPNNGISLNVESQSEAWVALSSVNFATYHFEGRRENSMKRILQSARKRDQDCGEGDGRNNAEGLSSTGLTVLTNVPAENSPQDAGSYIKIPRSKRDLKEEIQERASTFKYKRLQKCCLDGALETEESCWERAERVRIRIGPSCSNAFSICCDLANELRGKISHSQTTLGRYPETPRLESYRRSENWLWKVYHVSKRYQVNLTLPDSLTTWGIQAVSISDKGLCVTDELQLKVSKDRFLVTNNNVTRTFPRPSRLQRQRLWSALACWTGQDEADYILGLKIEDFLEWHLQTQVFKLGLAKSIHPARVLICQRHIRRVGGHLGCVKRKNTKKGQKGACIGDDKEEIKPLSLTAS